MIKALFIAVALAAAGGVGSVYGQATPQPSSGGDAAATPPAGGAATRGASNEPKKASPNTATEVKRDELGQKLLKRKMELDNERLNIQPAKAADRARDRKQETPPAENKGQKK